MPMPTFRTSADVKPVVEQPIRQTPSGVRTNAYGAKCAKCGGWVEPNQGRLDKVGGQWVTEHLGDCSEPQVATSQGRTEASDVPAHTPNVVNGQTLFDGIYTYETLVSHRTFRLRTQALDDSFMPGVQIVEHLTGPDNNSDYTSIGHIKGNRLSVWKKHQDKVTLVKDLQEFFRDPHGPNVLMSANCYRCGKILTVPSSLHSGYGPECARKGM